MNPFLSKEYYFILIGGIFLFLTTQIIVYLINKREQKLSEANK